MCDYMTGPAADWSQIASSYLMAWQCISGAAETSVTAAVLTEDRFRPASYSRRAPSLRTFSSPPHSFNQVSKVIQCRRIMKKSNERSTTYPTSSMRFTCESSHRSRRRCLNK